MSNSKSLKLRFIDKMSSFFSKVKQNIKKTFFLCKYYFFNILKRNWLLFYFFFVISLFSAFFFPVLFFVIRGQLFQWAINREEEREESKELAQIRFLSNLTGGIASYFNDYFISQKEIYRGKLSVVESRQEKDKVFELEEKIREKRKEVAKLEDDERGYNTNIKILEDELGDLFDEYKSLTVGVVEDSLYSIPFFSPFIIPLTTGKVTINKPGSFFLLAVKRAFWHYGTGFTFLLIAWLLRELFDNFRKEGEDAMIILAYPGITRGEIFLSKFLTFAGFLSLFSLVGFVYPFWVCWFLFGVASIVSIVNLFAISFFMLLIAPILFSLIASLIILFSSFTNQYLFLFGVFFIVLLPWAFLLKIPLYDSFFYDLLKIFSFSKIALLPFFFSLLSLFYLKKKYDRASISWLN